jgi:N utilization substance protein B
MKTAADPRHKQREAKVAALFAHSFQPDITAPELAEIAPHLPEIDATIAAAAPEWPLAKINKLDLAVLRVATYELRESDTPAKVVIDEAVEIAKRYGAESSGSFVNGVLGTILKSQEARP